MAEILFIKTSSLGDVVHHMPALTEARKARPDAVFTWLVEEAFAPLIALHPAVNKVIPVAWRRWRKSLYAPATLGQIGHSLRDIRAHRYDLIVDSQGLLRSGIFARLAHGRRHGYDSSSIREPLASLFYDVRHRVSRELHAVERNRILSGLSLGYSPQGAPDFGLTRAHLATPDGGFAVLLHATARAEKQWPEKHWIALGRALARENFDLVLPWGTPDERERSDRIAAALPRARVPDQAPLGTRMSDAIIVMTTKGFGCVGITDPRGLLVGMITDGDLRRHMRNDLLDQRVDDVMTRSPKTVRPDQLISETLELLNSTKVTAVFAVEGGKPVGIIHIHDLLRAGAA